MMKAKIPKNTDINTRWAMKNFTDWLSDYNLQNPESVCPEEVILPLCPAETLNKWLCVYAVETRSQSGEPYPPASLYSLLSGTSALFDAGVPEKIIQGRTGHHSLDALRVYERVTEEQDSKVSTVTV